MDVIGAYRRPIDGWPRSPGRAYPQCQLQPRVAHSNLV